MEQFRLRLTSKNNRRYSKHLLLLAAEIVNVSPSAYRRLRSFDTLILPSERLIRKLLSKSFQDCDLKNIFEKLIPEQRIVNILFDEVKLVETTRFTASHITGYATNLDSNSRILATAALVFEIICHHGGPRYILRIDPVAKLNAEQLKSFIQEVVVKVRNQGGFPLAAICDNCRVNEKAFKLLGGPGKVSISGQDMYLTFDYDHVHKNLRNNWITEPSKEIKFNADGTDYLARWKDIENLYKEDSTTALRLTSLNHTAVNPKPLQR